MEALSNGELDIFIKNEGQYEAQTKAIRELHGTEKVVPVDDDQGATSTKVDDEQGATSTKVDYDDRG